MKVFNLIHGDKVWVYNLTKKVYNELEMYKHNKDNTTMFSVTGREEKYLPTDAITISAIKLTQEEQGGIVTYHVIQRHSLWDRLREFKNSMIATVKEEFAEDGC